MQVRQLLIFLMLLMTVTFSTGQAEPRKRAQNVQRCEFVPLGGVLTINTQTGCRCQDGEVGYNGVRTIYRGRPITICQPSFLRLYPTEEASKEPRCDLSAGEMVPILGGRGGLARDGNCQYFTCEASSGRLVMGGRGEETFNPFDEASTMSCLLANVGEPTNTSDMVLPANSFLTDSAINIVIREPLRD